jgi:hypothetical protein
MKGLCLLHGRPSPKECKESVRIRLTRLQGKGMIQLHPQQIGFNRFKPAWRVRHG